MALSYNMVDKNVTGKFRQHILSCTADASSGIVDTGLAVIVAFSIQPVSMATNGGTYKKNLGSLSTARNGILTVNSLASGDDFYVIAYGR